MRKTPFEGAKANVQGGRKGPPNVFDLAKIPTIKKVVEERKQPQKSTGLGPNRVDTRSQAQKMDQGKVPFTFNRQKGTQTQARDKSLAVDVPDGYVRSETTGKLYKVPKTEAEEDKILAEDAAHEAKIQAELDVEGKAVTRANMNSVQRRNMDAGQSTQEAIKNAQSGSIATWINQNIEQPLVNAGKSIGINSAPRPPLSPYSPDYVPPEVSAQLLKENPNGLAGGLGALAGQSYAQLRHELPANFGNAMDPNATNTEALGGGLNVVRDFVLAAMGAKDAAGIAKGAFAGTRRVPVAPDLTGAADLLRQAETTQVAPFDALKRNLARPNEPTVTYRAPQRGTGREITTEKNMERQIAETLQGKTQNVQAPAQPKAPSKAVTPRMAELRTKAVNKTATPEELATLRKMEKEKPLKIATKPVEPPVEAPATRPVAEVASTARKNQGMTQPTRIPTSKVQEKPVATSPSPVKETVTAKGGKKPHEMTREEYARQGGDISYSAKGGHRDFVEQAVARGEDVSPEVLKGYPWLAADKAIKPYVDEIPKLTEKQLKAEAKRLGDELNKWSSDNPAMLQGGKLNPAVTTNNQPYFEIANKLNAVNNEIDARSGRYVPESKPPTTPIAEAKGPVKGTPVVSKPTVMDASELAAKQSKKLDLEQTVSNLQASIKKAKDTVGSKWAPSADVEQASVRLSSLQKDLTKAKAELKALGDVPSGSHSQYIASKTRSGTITPEDALSYGVQDSDGLISKGRPGSRVSRGRYGERTNDLRIVSDPDAVNQLHSQGLIDSFAVKNQIHVFEKAPDGAWEHIGSGKTQAEALADAKSASSGTVSISAKTPISKPTPTPETVKTPEQAAYNPRARVTPPRDKWRETMPEPVARSGRDTDRLSSRTERIMGVEDSPSPDRLRRIMRTADEETQATSLDILADRAKEFGELEDVAKSNAALRDYLEHLRAASPSVAKGHPSRQVSVRDYDSSRLSVGPKYKLDDPFDWDSLVPMGADKKVIAEIKKFATKAKAPTPEQTLKVPTKTKTKEGQWVPSSGDAYRQTISNTTGSKRVKLEAPSLQSIGKEGTVYKVVDSNDKVLFEGPLKDAKKFAVKAVTPITPPPALTGLPYEQVAQLLDRLATEANVRGWPAVEKAYKAANDDMKNVRAFYERYTSERGLDFMTGQAIKGGTKIKQPNEEAKIRAREKQLEREIADLKAGKVKPPAGKLVSDRITELTRERDALKTSSPTHPTLAKVLAAPTELAKVARSLIATGDVSAPFTQGGVAMLTDTGAWGKGAAKGLKSLSKKQYDAVLSEIAKDADYARVSKTGIDMPGLTNTDKPEVYFDTLLNRKVNVGGRNINAVGALMDASNRSYDGTLTVLRYNMAKNYIKMAEASGKKLDDAGLKVIGDAVNTLTGRGSGKLAKGLAQAEAGNALFAPSYWVSQFEAASAKPIRDGLKYAAQTGNWGPLKVTARKYTRLLAASYGVIQATDYALDQIKSDWKLDTDVRSANYGRLVKQKGGTITTMDYLPPQLMGPVKFVGQLAFGKKVGDDVRAPTKFARTTAVGNLFENKLAPVPKNVLAVWDSFHGEKTYGKDYDPRKLEGIKNLAVGGIPLSAQQAKEIAESKGLTPEEKAVLLAMSVFGRGGNSYQPTGK